MAHAAQEPRFGAGRFFHLLPEFPQFGFCHFHFGDVAYGQDAVTGIFPVELHVLIKA